MAKEYSVSVYDYDTEIGSTVIVDHEEFDNEKDAMQYAQNVEHSISSRSVVYGNHGYKVLARGSRRHFTLS